MQFRVSQVALVRNVRGDEMRRIHMVPLAGEAFGGKDVPPEAQFTMVLTPEAAKRFQIGDEFDVSFREREK